MTVRTDRTGDYDRTFLVGGTLKVTPMRPTSATTFVPTGEPVWTPSSSKPTEAR